MFYFQNQILIMLALFGLALFLKCTKKQAVYIAVFFGVLSHTGKIITLHRAENVFWNDMEYLLAQPYEKMTEYLVDKVRQSEANVELVRIFEEVHANAYLISSVWNNRVDGGDLAYTYFVKNLINSHKQENTYQFKHDGVQTTPDGLQGEIEE